MTAIWDCSPAKGSELLLLLAMADVANDAGICYPGVTTLAKKIRMTERHTQNLLRKLESEGLVKTGFNAGALTAKGLTNRYRILLPDPELPMFQADELPEKLSTGVNPNSPHNRGEKFSPHSQKEADGVNPSSEWGEPQFTQTVSKPSVKDKDQIFSFWPLALNLLRGQMTKATFDRLLAGSELTESEPGRYVVLVTTEAAADWLRRWEPRIVDALQQAGATVVSVRFEARP
jgi:hypothetical protein